MNNKHIAGIVGALIVLAIVIATIAMGAPSVVYLWPVEALNGIAFAFAWGLGVPVWLAYVFASLIFCAFACAGYAVGRTVYRLVASRWDRE
ncbi:hypothetical protein L4C36_01755 [Photobacterium japonica]|uniref:hypothetical protein n=1 Tax=Photobacterium japonica TaxID=2910235 RepID=UPI003D0D96F2